MECPNCMKSIRANPEDFEMIASTENTITVRCGIK